MKRAMWLVAVLLVLVVKCRSEEEEEDCAAEKGRFKCALGDECLPADKVHNWIQSMQISETF